VASFWGPEGLCARGARRVEVPLEVPTTLTDKQRALLAEFAAESGEELSAQQRSFMDKLRDLFG